MDLSTLPSVIHSHAHIYSHAHHGTQGRHRQNAYKQIPIVAGMVPSNYTASCIPLKKLCPCIQGKVGFLVVHWLQLPPAYYATTSCHFPKTFGWASKRPPKTTNTLGWNLKFKKYCMQSIQRNVMPMYIFYTWLQLRTEQHCARCVWQSVARIKPSSAVKAFVTHYT